MLAGALVHVVGHLTIAHRDPDGIGAKWWWFPAALALGVAAVCTGGLSEIIGEYSTFDEFAIVFLLGLGLGLTVSSFVCRILPRVDETTVLAATAMYWFLLATQARERPILAGIGAAIAIAPSLLALRMLLDREPASPRVRTALYAWWLVAMIGVGISLVLLSGLFELDADDPPIFDALVGGMVVVGILANATSLLGLARGAIGERWRVVLHFYEFGERQAAPLRLILGLAVGVGALWANEMFNVVSTDVALGTAYTAVLLVSDGWRRAVNVQRPV